MDEYRFSTGVAGLPKLATKRTDGKAIIRGYAAVWYRKGDPGSQYDMQHFLERIAKGAFADCIKRKQDVRALYNHDASLMLGRTAAGTLKLTEDSVGLAYEVTLPNTQLAHDVAENLRVGNISGSSFSFRIADESWTRENGADIRTITKIETLFDVGPVTYPAYQSSTSGLRAIEAVADMAEEARRRQRRRNANLAALGRKWL